MPISFNGLDTKLEISEDLIVGEWRDIPGTRDIFGSGLSVSHSQDFLYITNDPETPVPRGVRKNSRKQVLVQYSSELVPFVQEIYPSKRRNDKFPIELMGGKIEATNTKVMMTSQLPNDLTTPTGFLHWRDLKLLHYQELVMFEVEYSWRTFIGII